MKKRFLSLLMALCLVVAMMPAALAADTSGLQTLINNDTTGTINLTQDYTLTDTVAINKAITINGNGHTITYSGSGSALSITATAAVVLDDVKINATANGAYGISLTSNQPNLKLDGCTITANNRGISMYPAGGCSNGKLEIIDTTIQNSQVTGDYADNTSVGDTRGIALYGVENSDIDITNSHIYGFGYSINTSANQGDDGTRPASNRFDITGTDIWGWSAFNIWTVGNSFNLINCDMRGINPLDTVGNSFSVIVLNEGIYGSQPDQVSPNTFNIEGGTYLAKCTTDSANVEETLFAVDDDYKSVFNFSTYYNEETETDELVTLYCDRPFAAFMACYWGMTEEGMESWAASHVTGNLNTTYNWGLLAPGMYSSPWLVNAMSENDLISTILDTFSEGGGIE